MTAPAEQLNPATKRCWKCETTKAVADFSKDKSRQDGMNPLCKPCAKATRQAYLEKHPDAQREAYAKWYAKPENAKRANSASIERNRERADLLIKQFKSHACMDCGNTFPTCCMDFDHRLGAEKSFELRYRNFACKPIEVLIDEIAKCDLVCANCHRIRTVTRNQPGRKGIRKE